MLLVGYEPEAVDVSDPSPTPALDAEKIHAGIRVTLEAMQRRGWTTGHRLIRPDDEAVPTLRRKRGSASFDCLVIGACGRAWARHRPVFEAVINATREAAPTVPVAFNTKPQDSVEAVERVLGLKRPRSRSLQRALG